MYHSKDVGCGCGGRVSMGGRFVRTSSTFPSPLLLAKKLLKKYPTKNKTPPKYIILKNKINKQPPYPH